MSTTPENPLALQLVKYLLNVTIGDQPTVVALLNELHDGALRDNTRWDHYFLILQAFHKHNVSIDLNSLADCPTTPILRKRFSNLATDALWRTLRSINLSEGAAEEEIDMLQQWMHAFQETHALLSTNVPVGDAAKLEQMLVICYFVRDFDCNLDRSARFITTLLESYSPEGQARQVSMAEVFTVLEHCLTEMVLEADMANVKQFTYDILARFMPHKLNGAYDAGKITEFIVSCINNTNSSIRQGVLSFEMKKALLRDLLGNPFFTGRDTREQGQLIFVSIAGRDNEAAESFVPQLYLLNTDTPSSSVPFNDVYYEYICDDLSAAMRENSLAQLLESVYTHSVHRLENLKAKRETASGEDKEQLSADIALETIKCCAYRTSCIVRFATDAAGGLDRLNYLFEHGAQQLASLLNEMMAEHNDQLHFCAYVRKLAGSGQLAALTNNEQLCDRLPWLANWRPAQSQRLHFSMFPWMVNQLTPLGRRYKRFKELFITIVNTHVNNRNIPIQLLISWWRNVERDENATLGELRMMTALVMYYELLDKGRVSARLRTSCSAFFDILQLKPEEQIVIDFLAEPEVNGIKYDGEDPFFARFLEPGCSETETVQCRHVVFNLFAILLSDATGDNPWYTHIFNPSSLAGTYGMGNQYAREIGRPIHYDCGTELSQDGGINPGRPKRDPLDLNSLYFVILYAYSCFTLGLLTQRQAHDGLMGPVLTPSVINAEQWRTFYGDSAEKRIRNYVWERVLSCGLHIQSKLGLNNEERAMLITSGLENLRVAFSTPDARNYCSGVYTDMARLEIFELWLKESVLVPAVDNRQRYFQSFEEVTALDQFYRNLPSVATFTTIASSIGMFWRETATAWPLNFNTIGKLPERKLKKYQLLKTYFEKTRDTLRHLAMVPTIVDLYQIFSLKFAHHVTRDQLWGRDQDKTTIKTLIKKHITDHDQRRYILDLYTKLKLQWNAYVDFCGGNIAGGACRQNNVLPQLEDNPALGFFVTLPQDTDQGNYLMRAVQELVEVQNAFLVETHNFLEAANRTERLFCEHHTNTSVSVALAAKHTSLLMRGDIQDKSDTSPFTSVIMSHTWRSNEVPAEARPLTGGPLDVAIIDWRRIQLELLQTYISAKPLLDYKQMVIQFQVADDRAKDLQRSKQLESYSAQTPEVLKEQLLEEESDLLVIQHQASSPEYMQTIEDQLKLLLNFATQYVQRLAQEDDEQKSVSQLTSKSIAEFVTSNGLQGVEDKLPRHVLLHRVGKLLALLEFFTIRLPSNDLLYQALPQDVKVPIEKAVAEGIVQAIKGHYTADARGKEQLQQQLHELSHAAHEEHAQQYIVANPTHTLAFFYSDIAGFPDDEPPLRFIPNDLTGQYYVSFMHLLTRIQNEACKWEFAAQCINVWRDIEQTDSTYSLPDEAELADAAPVQDNVNTQPMPPLIAVQASRDKGKDIERKPPRYPENITPASAANERQPTLSPPPPPEIAADGEDEIAAEDDWKLSLDSIKPAEIYHGLVEPEAPVSPDPTPQFVDPIAEPTALTDAPPVTTSAQPGDPRMNQVLTELGFASYIPFFTEQALDYDTFVDTPIADFIDAMKDAYLPKTFPAGLLLKLRTKHKAVLEATGK